MFLVSDSSTVCECAVHVFLFTVLVFFFNSDTKQTEVTHSIDSSCKVKGLRAHGSLNLQSILFDCTLVSYLFAFIHWCHWNLFSFSRCFTVLFKYIICVLSQCDH